GTPDLGLAIRRAAPAGAAAAAFVQPGAKTAMPIAVRARSAIGTHGIGVLPELAGGAGEAGGRGRGGRGGPRGSGRTRARARARVWQRVRFAALAPPRAPVAEPAILPRSKPPPSRPVSAQSGPGIR